MEKEIEFDKQDWAAMHDAFMHVTGRKPSQEELEALYTMLPHDLQGDAKEWGMNDTLWRDRFIEWYQRHLKVRFPSDKRSIHLLMNEALHASYGFHVDNMSEFPLPKIQPSDDGEYWRVCTKHLCGFDHLCDTQDEAGCAAYWLFCCISGVLNPPVRPHEGSCTPESGCDGTCMDAAYLSDRELKQSAPPSGDPPPDMSEFHKNVERLANLIERAKQSPPEQRPTS